MLGQEAASNGACAPGTGKNAGPDPSEKDEGARHQDAGGRDPASYRSEGPELFFHDQALDKGLQILSLRVLTGTGVDRKERLGHSVQGVNTNLINPLLIFHAWSGSR